jgi:ribokinase
MFDVVVVGSVNLDVVARSPRIPQPGETVSGTSYDEFPGGKGLNQAVAAARAGASVALVAAVGDDAPGNHLRGIVRAEGIVDTWVTTVSSQPTGRALIVVDDAGENSIVVTAGANASLLWPTAVPPVGRVMLGQLEVPIDVVEAAFSNARRTGALTVLNPAPACPLPPRLLDSCSLLVPNEHEVALLGPRAKLLASVDALIVTRGSDGADIATNEAPHLQHVASFDVQAIDSTGAGDAFCGNLAARLAVGAPRQDAIRWACAAGALATTVRGAVPSLPSHEQVSALLG